MSKKRNNPVQKRQRDRTLSEQLNLLSDLSGPSTSKRPNNLTSTNFKNLLVSIYEELKTVEEKIDTLQLTVDDNNSLLSKNNQLREDEKNRRRERAY